MTTVSVYKSEFADMRMKVRWGRKHGRPRGRGRKSWQIIDRLYWNPLGKGWEPAPDDARDIQRRRAYLSNLKQREPGE